MYKKEIIENFEKRTLGKTSSAQFEKKFKCVYSVGRIHRTRVFIETSSTLEQCLINSCHYQVRRISASCTLTPAVINVATFRALRFNVSLITCPKHPSANIVKLELDKPIDIGVLTCVRVYNYTVTTVKNRLFEK